MSTATRLSTDMASWAPTTRHYQVDGGHLAVTVNTFLTATGTDVFYAEADGSPVSLTPLLQYPEGTTHDEALQNMGYTVVDTIGDPDPGDAEPDPPDESAEQSVLDLLPPEIAAMIANAQQSQENP